MSESKRSGFNLILALLHKWTDRVHCMDPA